jgi:hypothetical protein
MNVSLYLNKFASKAIITFFLALIIIFSIGYLFETIDAYLSQFYNYLLFKVLFYSSTIFISIILIRYIFNKSSDDEAPDEIAPIDTFKIQDILIFDNIGSKFLSGLAQGLTKKRVHDEISNSV